MSSLYYDLFNIGNIGESILDEELGNKSFEDHYWHLACVAKYYEIINDSENEKAVLTKLCDMNYVFNALYHYKKYDCLPNKYNQYIIPFENSMVDQRIEDRINYFNKQERKNKNKKYWFTSLTTLISIPLMLFLMLVCKMDSTTAIIITIVAIMLIELMTNPFMENGFLQRSIRNIFSRKKKQYVVPEKLNKYFKYLDRFIRIVNNDLYLALARAQNDDEIEKIVKTIKERKPQV